MSAPEDGAGFGWVRLGSERLYEGAFIALDRDRVVQPDGRPGSYEHITVPDSVRVVVLGRRDEIVLVEDDFYLQGRRVLHLPGGAIEPGETALEAAAREVAEETGWLTEDHRPLGAIDPLPSSTRAVTQLVLATAVRRSQPRRDATEAAMTVRWEPLPGALELVEAGAITEAGSVAAILLAARRRGPAGTSPGRP